MAIVRKHLKLIIVAASCAVIGAGASAIASAGAASGSSQAPNAKTHKFLGGRGKLWRAVHGDFVIATKTGFATVTLDSGYVQSLTGQQLTLREGTKTATYKTVTLTIPADARVRDSGQKATLADVKPGQHVLVLQWPKRTKVIARDA